MADFSVRVQVLTNSKDNLSVMSCRLESIADEAKYVISQVGRTAVGDLFDTIHSIKTHNDINNCSNDMRNLAKALETIAELYNKTETCIINKNFTENRVIRINGVRLRVGDSFLGCVVSDISEDGKLVLKRETHILKDVYNAFDDYPLIQAAMAVGCSPTYFFAEGFAKDATQTIIIDMFGGEADGDTGNLFNANGSIEGHVQKITYITEGEYYRSEIEVTGLYGEAGGEIRSWDPEALLSPANFLRGEADVGAGNIKGNVRFGTVEDNVNVGLEIDLASAEANINEGIGGISYEDAEGQRQEGNGISVGVGASASVVEGTLTVQTVKDGKASTVAVSTDYLGAGGEAGLAVTDEGISANLDIEAIIGVGIAISQDW